MAVSIHGCYTLVMHRVQEYVYHLKIVYFNEKRLSLHGRLSIRLLHLELRRGCLQYEGQLKMSIEGEVVRMLDDHMIKVHMNTPSSRRCIRR